MSDNITLPREVVEQLLKMLEMVEPYADQFTDYSSTAAEWPLNLLPKKVSEAITALRTALAAEQPVPTDKDSLTHPGYIIGSHWLETAYSRVCAGEAEADVLRDIGLVREEAFLTGVAHLKAENEALRLENERLREALTYDWDQLEACRESLREHMVEIKRLREALKLALNSHGRMLMSDPPQDAWKFNRVDEVIVAALRREET